jgi:pumilio RNA-binding family
MVERRLIGNILIEDDDSDEDIYKRFTKTKRHVLLNENELAQLLERSTSAPADIQFNSFFSSPQDPIFTNFASPTIKSPLSPNFNTAAPEFVPSFKPLPESKKSELHEVKGRILELARDQAGSRYLQQKYENCSAEDKQMVFEEILENSFSLILDVFGNYVVQKILELSLHMYGCRVLQKVLDSVEFDQRRMIASEFRNNVEKAVEDQNGNHVIQKCIEILPYNDIVFIVDALKDNTVHWAEHQYGCRVIQKIIEYCPKENILKVFDLIIRNSIEISQKSYGNYVIQHILDKGGRVEKEALINSFQGRLFDLSKHKFAR